MFNTFFMFLKHIFYELDVPQNPIEKVLLLTCSIFSTGFAVGSVSELLSYETSPRGNV